jgi:hypothetical protein
MESVSGISHLAFGKTGGLYLRRFIARLSLDIYPKSKEDI